MSHSVRVGDAQEHSFTVGVKRFSGVARNDPRGRNTSFESKDKSD